MKNRTFLNYLLSFWGFALIVIGPVQSQITVNSDFEGGNGVATYTNELTNEVDILSELKGGDTKNISYYVEISGLDPNMPLTLKVSAQWRGHNIVYSYDNINWEKATLTNLNNFIVPLISPTVYVAHSYPYTYSDMIADVNSISDLSFVNTYDLATSEGGRTVKLVKVTDDCADDSGKELIWIFGRMHAFENPGNLSVIGMLDFFTSEHESAKRLREEAIIYVVPMMDVDMAYNGGSGKDQNPVDFNRDWLYLNESSHWDAVSAAKIWIDSTAQLNNLSVFFDSHSPPPSHGTALFYYIYNPDHHLSNTRFVTESVNYLGGYQGDEEVYGGLDISTSQDYATSIYDNPKLYNVTMETGFDYRPDGVEWTKELYYLHGEYHAEAISDYIHGLSLSNDILIDNSDTENVEIVGDWTSDDSIPGYFGEDYMYTDTLSPAEITFNATIDSAGTYEVFTRWVSHTDFATNAKASFHYAEGTSNFILDLSLRGGNWVSLDTFYFEAGDQVSLTLSNEEANQRIIADGLRISKVRRCQTLPTQGTDKEQNPFTFNVYPNPANNHLTIQLGSNTQLDEVKIYTMLGHLVLTSKELLIDTSSLSAGLYIVEVKTDKGQGLKKLIVQ